MYHRRQKLPGCIFYELIQLRPYTTINSCTTTSKFRLKISKLPIHTYKAQGEINNNRENIELRITVNELHANGRNALLTGKTLSVYEKFRVRFTFILTSSSNRELGDRPRSSRISRIHYSFY